MKKSELKQLIREEVAQLITEKESFTRQHYQRIAKILKTTTTVKGVGEQLVDMFKEDNPRFDENRFRKAAGL